MIICGTGHRPNKLGGYDLQTFTKLSEFAKRMLEREKPSLVISGMALGWDMALANAAGRLGIPYHAYIPFRGQDSKWPTESQLIYQDLMDEAASVVECSPPGYAVWKMQRRNEDMVNVSDKVLALWNGTDGGTANCVRYANKVGKEVINVWKEWSGE